MPSYKSVGVDVSKGRLDCFSSETGEYISFDNDESGLDKLISWLHKEESLDAVICEPTGGYERLLVSSLVEANQPIIMVDAKRIRDFAKASGLIAKTDKLDAELISDYGVKMQPKPKNYIKNIELCEYVSRRKQLSELVKREKQNLEHVTNAKITTEIKDNIKYLKKKIAAVEKDIASAVNSDSVLTRKNEILTSCAGIGDVASATLLADLPELGTCNEKQIAALIGVAPMNNESGGYQGKRFTKGGRKNIRDILYMAALSAIRHNPDIKTFYDKLIAKGKAAKQAITACIRKLIITLNAMIRDDRLWTKEYNKN